MNSDLTKPAATFLTDLAAGKYDEQVALLEKALRVLAPEFPFAGELLLLLRGFVGLNRLTAPRGPSVPDGKGGWVPETNSRYDPETGKFL